MLEGLVLPKMLTNTFAVPVITEGVYQPSFHFSTTTFTVQSSPAAIETILNTLSGAVTTKGII